MRTLTHRCRTGGDAELERDSTSYDVPVWRCTAGCKTFFAVLDGETPTATEAK
jgi:hypothetical protein